MQLQVRRVPFRATELTSEEEREFKEILDYIDVSNNGVISKDDLANAFQLLYSSEEISKAEAEKTIKAVDLNKSGQIDYNEFLMANINEKNGLKPDRIERAFNFFDTVFSF